MIKLTVIPKKPFGTWQFGNIGVWVNFIIQKLKSKHLVCLSFLWWQVFLREREKTFYTYSRPKFHPICPLLSILGREARSNVVGIMCLPGWDRVNWSAKNCPSPPVAAALIIPYYSLFFLSKSRINSYWICFLKITIFLEFFWKILWSYFNKGSIIYPSHYFPHPCTLGLL